MLKNNVETFLACDAPYEDAKIVLFGAPFDSTTSFRPGTRFGSSAIRHESFGLETYSPYQDKDLEEYAVLTAGIWNCASAVRKWPSRTLRNGRPPSSRTGNCLSWWGAEHLVTLGAFRAVLKKYPDVQIIHFDAHTDLRDDYLGAKLSHACVIRRCHDLIGDGKIHQFCIRSGEKAEWQFARQHTDLHPFSFGGLEQLVRDLEKSQVPVYFTIDLDCLDPSVFPGTGTRKPGASPSWRC